MIRKMKDEDENLCVQHKRILQHMGLIQLTARRMIEVIPQEMSWEDVVQYGWIGLIESMGNYDAAKGSFSTFAIRYIYGSIMGGIYAFQGEKRLRNQRQKRPKRRQWMDVHIEWFVKESIRQSEEAQAQIQEVVEDHLSLVSALQKLAPEERRLLQAIYFERRSFEECAEKTQKSVHWLRVLHRRSLKKLRQWLMDERIAEKRKE